MYLIPSEDMRSDVDHSWSVVIKSLHSGARDSSGSEVFDVETLVPEFDL